MTTKKLENKLKISGDTCIHCPTSELAKQVLRIFRQLGLKWGDKTNYIKHTYWDRYKENTVYYPFGGFYSSLKDAQQNDYKIISAEEFIALHTEKEEFDLENYEPKGDLKGFPKEIIARMLECQEKQGNKRDVSIFEKNKFSLLMEGGFDWDITKEENDFWNAVIEKRNFDIFFEKYPKKEELKTCSKCHKEKPLSEFHKRGNTFRSECKECRKQEYQELKNNKNMQENNKKEEDSQEFRVGDKVIDILIGEIGIVKNINLHEIATCQVEVVFENNVIAFYSLEGKYYNNNKIPILLHYRDDYDYSVIDFNNLPKRQEPKRWRVEEGGCYHFVSFDERCWFYSNGAKDDYASFDNNNYNSGNYFRTEVEAEIIAQKLNSHFKQLIKEEHDTHRN